VTFFKEVHQKLCW